MAQEAYWVVVGAVGHVAFGFPDWDCDSGAPGRWGFAFLGDSIE